MKSKKIICSAIAATIVLGATFAGCTDLVSTINSEDMKQVIATVDISKSENLFKEGLSDYVSAITSKDIVKRDLISAFVNVGYSQVNNGSSYEDVFNSLVTSLTNNAVVTQYATLYMLKEKSGQDADALTKFTNSELTEVEKYEYLLGGEGSDDVNLAKYNLCTAVNNSLDTIEERYIDHDHEESGTDSRTTPSGIDTVKEDYYPKTVVDGKTVLNYGIYTGYDGYLLNSEWDYEPLDGTNRNTRRNAYNSFVTSLRNNYLVSEDDEDTTDVWNLNYIQDEYLAQLQQIVINNYYDLFSEQQEEIIKKVENGEYTFLKGRYETLVGSQENSYTTVSAFESAMGSASDTSFVLYSPDTTKNTEDKNGTFGYVYNILLPFNAVQSRQLKQLSDYKDKGVIDDEGYFNGRKAILEEIETTDQRAAWFNGTTDYSFKAAEAGLEDYFGKDGGREYLFFENNVAKSGENGKYEDLEKYIGLYSYNGTVTEEDDGTYTLKPNKLNIDDMLEEFKAYVDYVMGGAKTSYSLNSGYNTDKYYKDDKKKEIDYSKFVYASGKVDIGTPDKNSLLVKDTAQYKAMAAVNELQYAYTTDTGVLSQYLGYSVSAYSTNYIKEFEYAAQTAVKSGAGTFNVCAGDYGWHLIYVTDTFSPAGGETYTPQWTEERVINTEGSFENKFYEWIKDSILSDVTTTKRSIIIELFAGDTTITKYEKTYKDLLELGK